MTKGAVPVRAALEEVLFALGLGTVVVRARLAGEWSRVAQGYLEGRILPAGIRHGVLTILVESHPLAQELTFSKTLLLERIREVAGRDAVRDIRFRVAPLPAKKSGPPVEPVRRTDAKGPVPPALERIADPELRAILASLAQKAAQRRSP